MYEFGTSVVASTVIFLLISLPAVLLNIYVHSLHETNVSKWIIHVLTGFEYLIFLMDGILFLRFLLITFFNHFKGHDE